MVSVKLQCGSIVPTIGTFGPTNLRSSVSHQPSMSWREPSATAAP